VLGFLAVQLAVAAVLLWLSRRAPPSSPSQRLKWSLAYLMLVVLTHTAMVAASVQAGSLLLLMGWYYLGLPLFAPGFFLGLAALAWAFRGGALRPAKVVLGVLAVTYPVLEWLLSSGVIRSGYQG
jgi:membrane-bound ClpP family serine protease